MSVETTSLTSQAQRVECPGTPARPCGFRQKYFGAAILSAPNLGRYVAVPHLCERDKCRMPLVVVIHVSQVGEARTIRRVGAYRLLGRTASALWRSLAQCPELRAEGGDDIRTYMVADAEVSGWVESDEGSVTVPARPRRVIRTGRPAAAAR